jgi:hypothetical protein
MESLFISGSFQQQVRRLQKQQNHNPKDNYGLGGQYVKGIARVSVGAAPGAGGGKCGIGQGQEMDDGNQNDGRFGKNKSERYHGGNEIQDEAIGYQPAPESLVEGQLPKPKLPQRNGCIH